MLVYADVLDDGSEEFDGLFEQIKGLGAICFKKNVSALNLRFHSKRATITFFAIDRDEQDNINDSLDIVNSYKTRPNTKLFVFSTRPESEMLFSNASNDCIKVRRVNEARSLINRVLYEDGRKFFEHALPVSKTEKRISAVIVGLGRHGTEMLKALAWFCQMDGYSIEIDAFDRDELAEEKFAAACPELLSEEYNGVYVPGESEYRINIHSGKDALTKNFADKISSLKNATYVLVALGSDEENIRVAANLRMLFERIGANPDIDAIVYSTASRKALKGVKNYRGQAYNINYIGDIETSCSERVIINSEIEADALARHLKWGKEEEFWQYEYNYNSSVAAAIHMRARIACGIPGADKREEKLNESEKAAIEQLEHRRWNAYMRAEGYVYSGSPDKSSRNDLAKMHHDLVDFSSLSDEEKRKDSKVGLK